ncbi:hypothetical protein TWF192_002678 [Orbilia oligospora]|uniref:Uncharacterized protein n=1 Tax=Orbilia oligospora TaxID=2813651 RepID=A0A6G1MEF1_ORBOL|nr:hypothetical protein TWF191_011118 [Orbilia oligospora]KAF3255322.1 hypothetical protein TWF192_002678 [Orbilia oligospora]
MPYDLGPKTQQCEGDSIHNGASLIPVFCTTSLIIEDSRSMILATRINNPSNPPNSAYGFLDTIHGTPTALSSITHAICHPSPPSKPPIPSILDS